MGRDTLVALVAQEPGCGCQELKPHQSLPLSLFSQISKPSTRHLQSFCSSTTFHPPSLLTSLGRGSSPWDTFGTRLGHAFVPLLLPEDSLEQRDTLGW